MKNKHLFAAVCAATLGLGSAFAGGEGWINDFDAATKQAAEEKKDLLIDFTGSDWCGWCIRLKDEVFKHDAFKDGVKDKFVLVEIDFPRDKEKAGITDETAKQNDDLQQKYGIEGFPTILLTDASGKPFARTGYQAGGPEKYVEHLDELRAKKATRDEAFAKAEKAEGVEKAKALVSALEAMSLSDAAVASFYGEVVDQIKAADPKDETGFVKQIEDKKKYATFEQELGELMQAGDAEGAIALVEKTAKESGFEGSTLQKVIGIKGIILLREGKHAEAVAAIDAALEAAPDGEVAPQLKAMREQAAKAAEKGDEDEEEEEE